MAPKMQGAPLSPRRSGLADAPAQQLPAIVQTTDPLAAAVAAVDLEEPAAEAYSAAEPQGKSSGSLFRRRRLSVDNRAMIAGDTAASDASASDPPPAAGGGPNMFRRRRLSVDPRTAAGASAAL